MTSDDKKQPEPHKNEGKSKRGLGRPDKGETAGEGGADEQHNRSSNPDAVEQ